MNYSICMTGSAPFVASVDRRISEALRLADDADAGSKLLAEAAAHLCTAAGAKHFRPQLVHLFGGIFDLPEDPLRRIAVGAELIHAASLLHDDVIDAGTERRGRPTANVQWSNSVAVLAGDWLLTRATLEVAPLGITILSDAIETVRLMTASAIREVEARGSTTLTFAQWRTLAEGKAGELFAWALSSLALLGRQPELCGPFRQLGRQLGVSFQMGDDLKDLLDEHSGKDRFADLKNQNPSFALVVAMESSPELRQRIGEAWSAAATPADIGNLGQAVIETGALVAAQKLLKTEVQGAMASLSTLAPPAVAAAFVELAASFAGRQAAVLRGAA